MGFGIFWYRCCLYNWEEGESLLACMLNDWSNFFLGELGAAAALAGLLFVAVSVNQARILQLGRMADRGLEALAMLFLTMVVASLPLIPNQPLRLLGAEILAASILTLVMIVSLERAYLRLIEPAHRRHATQMVMFSRLAILTIASAGCIVVCRNDLTGIYLLPPGIFMTFAATGANAWVLLIEINR